MNEKNNRNKIEDLEKKVAEMNERVAEMNAEAVKIQNDINKLKTNGSIQMSETSSGPELINL